MKKSDSKGDGKCLSEVTNIPMLQPNDTQPSISLKKDEFSTKMKGIEKYNEENITESETEAGTDDESTTSDDTDTDCEDNLAELINKELLEAQYDPLKDETIDPTLATALSKLMKETTEKFETIISYHLLLQREHYEKKIKLLRNEQKLDFEKLLSQVSLSKDEFNI